MVFKKGNPLGWLLNQLQGVVGGVYFPVAVMPAFLRGLAGFLPVTYAVRGMQLAVYQGASLSTLSREVTVLAAFCAALAPLSLFSFHYALSRVRQTGTLSFY
jgi:ABC-2 type transport system permease protein